MSGMASPELLNRRLRPTVMINVQGYELSFPAEVIACFSVRTFDDDEPIVDMLFIQYYEHYFGDAAHPQPHPYVPQYIAYFLGDSFDIVPVESVVSPAMMIPRFAPNSDREPDRVRRSSRATGFSPRPLFFGLMNTI